MEGVIKRRRMRGLDRALISVAAVILLSAVILLGGERVGEYFEEGIRLAVGRVLPTAFPFMVLSSLACAMIDTDALPRTSRLFERIFSVSGSGFPALLIGWLAGFPIGARMTGEIYRQGGLERSEAERLIAYSSVASPAFTVAAVGVGMLGDKWLGVILLLSSYIGSVMTARLFRANGTFTHNPTQIARQKYDFVDAVKSAALSSIYMCAFVTLLFIITKSVTEALSSPKFGLLFSLPLEVTGALIRVSESGLSPFAMMGLSGFALGFGGLSVMAQTAAAIEGSGLSMRSYAPIKAASGAIGAISSMALFLLYSHLL